MGSFYQYYSICTPSVPQYCPIPRILPLFGSILDTTQYVPPAFLRNTTQYYEYYHYYIYSCSAEFTSAVDSRFIEAFDFALHRHVHSYLKNQANVLKNGAGSTWKAAYFWKPGLFCKKRAGSTWKNSRSLNTTQYYEYYPIPRIPRSLPRR